MLSDQVPDLGRTTLTVPDRVLLDCTNNPLEIIVTAAIPDIYAPDANPNSWLTQAFNQTRLSCGSIELAAHTCLLCSIPGSANVALVGSRNLETANNTAAVLYSRCSPHSKLYLPERPSVVYSTCNPNQLFWLFIAQVHTL